MLPGVRWNLSKAASILMPCTGLEDTSTAVAHKHCSRMHWYTSSARFTPSQLSRCGLLTPITALMQGSAR